MTTVRIALITVFVVALPKLACGFTSVSLRPNQLLVHLRPYSRPLALRPGDIVDVYVRDDANPEGRLFRAEAYVFAVVEGQVCLLLPKDTGSTLRAVCDQVDVIVCLSRSQSSTPSPFFVTSTYHPAPRQGSTSRRAERPTSSAVSLGESTDTASMSTARDGQHSSTLYTVFATVVISAVSLALLFVGLDSFRRRTLRSAETLRESRCPKIKDG